MPTFKRPGPPPSREKTGGGFDKPAEAPKHQRTMLEKKSIDEELGINDLHINEELMAQPLLMRKYTKETASLRKKRDSIQAKLEMQEAALTMTLSNDGCGRKVAEIQAMVSSDGTVQKLKGELADAEEQVGEYEGIVKAIAQRYEMLKELCANLRKEMV